MKTKVSEPMFLPIYRGNVDALIPNMYSVSGSDERLKSYVQNEH